VSATIEHGPKTPVTKGKGIIPVRCGGVVAEHGLPEI
jgi:hypothetical protein